MRTTLTLDPDVAARINKEAAKGDRTFKEIVNDALRRGLASPARPKKRFVQRTYAGGGFPPWEEIKRMLQDEDLERYK
ncbi:MAG: ribbon-helix-helix domain-containing protein [Cyanobacteria bacterium]|nr:ribbon-helix-helix domain-containing protein [Cyanobacteriota bacterium]